jgi:hypothetical protein
MIEQPDLLSERFAALADPHDDSDWQDVTRRARRGLRRPWLALPLAAALAAIVVGSALGLYGQIVDFFSAEPAPERIVVHFGQMTARAKIFMGPHVDAEKARKVTEATIGGKRRSLYVAPTADGGFCWMWEGGAGSCGRTTLASKRSVSAVSLESPGHDGAARIYGDVVDPAVVRLEVALADGERAEVSVVWVSPPIDAGFFIHEAPSDRNPILALVGFDKDGRELYRQEMPRTDPRWEPGADGLPRVADRMKKRTLFDFRDHRGQHWTLVVAPAPEEETCWAYSRGGGCVSPKHPAIIGGMSPQSGESVNLCCAVADGVATVELRYQDGARKQLTPVDGFLLYVIPPEHYRLGHRLEQLVWRDAAGKEVAQRTFKPDQAGIYPCEPSEELDLGYGQKVCP